MKGDHSTRSYSQEAFPVLPDFPQVVMTSPPSSSSESTSRRSPTSNPSSLSRILSLIESYQSINPSFIPHLNSTPTSLQFLRDHVALNRPVLLKAQGRRERACRTAVDEWDEEYLCQKMQGRIVQVAVSPDGNADAIVKDDVNGKEYFVEPSSVPMTLSTLFEHLHDRRKGGPVYYLQSQNGNLQGEGDLSALLDDVGSDGPEWAKEAFGTSPDAVNIWIGDDQSVTSTHKDPYENIYLVIKGSKTFTLLPPTEYLLLEEKTYPHATYSFEAPSKFSIDPTKPSTTIPWLSIDPSSPPAESLFNSHAKPLIVTVEAGDMLYLPALWFHKVQQSNNDERDDVVIAVNWWYDVKMEGGFWEMNEFLRRLSQDALEELRKERFEGVKS